VNAPSKPAAKAKAEEFPFEAPTGAKGSGRFAVYDRVLGQYVTAPVAGKVSAPAGARYAVVEV
jgi:hypothetical protein